jgi:hypothetical protein
MRRASKILLGTCAAVALLAVGRPAPAADSPMGTWTKTGDSKRGQMTMSIERWGKGGAKLVYRLVGTNVVLTLETPLDGSDAPLMMNGQPTGETMGIKRLDGHHAATVLKMNGKPFGSSKSTFSDDFTTLTIENEVQHETNMGPPTGKSTEVWTRK